MSFDFQEIGRRIKAERKNHKWTQDALVQELHKVGCPVKRATISHIETGKIEGDSINAKLIISLCEVFSCDPNYLFGTIQEHTEEKHYIQSFTGLSEDSIEMLFWLRTLGDTAKIKVIDYLLRDNHVKPIPPGINEEDNGLLALLAAYFLTEKYDAAKEIPKEGITVSVGGSTLFIESGLIENALMNEITAQVRNYRKELQNNKFEIKKAAAYSRRKA